MRGRRQALVLLALVIVLTDYSIVSADGLGSVRHADNAAENRFPPPPPPPPPGRRFNDDGLGDTGVALGSVRLAKPPRGPRPPMPPPRPPARPRRP